MCVLNFCKRCRIAINKRHSQKAINFAKREREILLLPMKLHKQIIKLTLLLFHNAPKCSLWFGLVLLLMHASGNLHAQINTAPAAMDSTAQRALESYAEKLTEIRKQQVADSLKKAALETELQSLKTTDNLKKEELQKQLQEIKDQEARRLKAKKARIDSLRLTTRSYPVMGLFDDTLFFIYSKLGSFSAHDRAEAISERISKVASVIRFNADSIITEASEGTIDIVFGQSIIMSVSENDALWENTTTTALAARYQKIIGDEILRYKSETNIISLLKEIALALLVLLIVGAVIYYSLRLFRWFALKIMAQENVLLKGIKIRNYTLFDAKRQVNVLLTLNTILKWIFILIVVYIALPIVFGIFPWTKNFAAVLFGYILDPLKVILSGIWNYLPNLITIAVIVVFFHYIIKGIHFLSKEVENGALSFPGFFPDWASPTFQIVRFLIYAFMLIVIFPYLPGSESPVFQGVSVFLGVLFTFGSSGSLSNIIAGLVITYMRAFKVGDRVKIGEITGDIIERSLLVTRIRTTKNEVISIPNSNVMNSNTLNYSSEAEAKGLILHTTVTIGYDVPWKNMHQALIAAAGRTELLLKDPPPFVLQTSLDDFYVSYQINAYTHEPNKQAFIYSQLHQNIQDCCNEAGIEILSPHYRAARDGNRTTIPDNYLGKDYEAPGFNVHVKTNDKP